MDDSGGARERTATSNQVIHVRDGPRAPHWTGSVPGRTEPSEIRVSAPRAGRHKHQHRGRATRSPWQESGWPSWEPRATPDTDGIGGPRAALSGFPAGMTRPGDLLRDSGGR
jgi:hypothetical protein